MLKKKRKKKRKKKGDDRDLECAAGDLLEQTKGQRADEVDEDVHNASKTFDGLSDLVLDGFLRGVVDDRADPVWCQTMRERREARGKRRTNLTVGFSSRQYVLVCSSCVDVLEMRIRSYPWPAK